MLFLSLSKLKIPSQLSHIDAIELRLDLLPQVDIEQVDLFLKNSPLPIMLTLRKGAENLILKLLNLEPDFFDLEYDMRSDFLHAAIKNYPKTKIVLSYHNFDVTPKDLEAIYSSMKKYPAFGFKIAAMTHSTNDALKMLLFARKHPKVSAICMGEKGSFARVLNFSLNYACSSPEEKTAPGQLTVSELVDIYRYPTLNRETEIYGLIGDPISQSPGHIFHNDAFQKKGMNAVYVKMTVKPEELEEFLFLAQEMDIRGLSVTIPLKEKIPSFAGSVNTLFLKNGKISAINTDGVGALEVIEKKTFVTGKKMVLLGAGGTARAIALEAKKRGAEVWICNRTEQRAKDLAKELGCQAGFPPDYDIVVNCAPEPIPMEHRLNTIAMDVVYFPRVTTFLQNAILEKCQIVYGEEMFLAQAAKQTAFWLEKTSLQAMS